MGFLLFLNHKSSSPTSFVWLVYNTLSHPQFYFLIDIKKTEEEPEFKKPEPKPEPQNNFIPNPKPEVTISVEEYNEYLKLKKQNDMAYQ